MTPDELVKVFYQLEPNEQYLIHTEPPTARSRKNPARQRLDQLMAVHSASSPMSSHTKGIERETFVRSFLI